MLIFLDDFICSLQSVGGISVYWTSVLKEINVSSYKNFVLVKISGSNNILSPTVSWRKKIISETKLPFSLSRVLPFYKKLPPKSLFHSSYLRVSLQKDVCNIVTIHDLAAELGKIKGFRRWLKLAIQYFAIKNADGIICVSKATKTSLLKFYPKFSKNNVTVIHHGCSDLFYPKPEHEGYKNIILFIGGRGQYKNFDTCVKVLANLPKYELLMIGGGELSDSEDSFLKKKLERRFRHIKNVSTDKLNDYYNEAFCLLYSSYYEGFGMPILEAMKAGCPVITTNIAAIKEVADNGAILVENFLNTDEYINAIHRLEQQDIRLGLIDRGLQRASLFSWERHCKEQLAFYQDIYYKKFGEPLIYKTL